MSYMVMETNLAYAVVLDERGCFSKAANLSYAVGDVVEEIVPLRTPAKRPGRRARIMSLLAAAACFTALIFGAYQQNYATYGTVRLRINPDVLLSVSKSERVLRLEGLNADGDTLISGYDYKGKSQDAVTVELVERAAGMGFVGDGGQVSITLDGDARWQKSAEKDITSKLQSGVDGVALTVYLGTPGEGAPHSAIRTAPESAYWEGLYDGELPAIDFAQFGEAAGEYAAQVGEQLGELGGQMGEQLGDMGKQVGEQLGEFGRQTGENLEAWGEQAEKQIDKAVDSAIDQGQYWSGVVQEAVDSGNIGGIVDRIIGLF